MRVHRLHRLGERPPVDPGGCATIGVFDGVHLGHQRLLCRVLERASDLPGPALVATFAVHPVVVVKGLPPRAITSLEHRLALFERIGVEECVVLPFDEELRRTPAARFVRLLFAETLRIGALVVGPDARVGRDREGDVSFLERFARRRGIAFEVVPPVLDRGEPISSTRVRAAIADGDLARASRMLGRRVSLLGTVVAGNRRGRGLGFPTANLDLEHEIRPPPGVYAAFARLGDARWPAVCNIGVRPTFGPDGDLIVEVHVLDRDLDLYGRTLEVELVERLRGEQRFPDEDALRRRIQADCERARALLRNGRTDSGSE